MSKNIETEQRTHRQQTPTKIIVERHYVLFVSLSEPKSSVFLQIK